MGRSDKIYARLPIWAQTLAINAYGLHWKRVRFGQGYQQFTDEYRRREKFSEQEWQEWHQQRLRETLTHAAKNVPYYRETWTEAQKQAAEQGALERIPLLEKEPLRSNPESFVRDDIEIKKRLVLHTSGSTGTPIKTIWDFSEYRDNRAVREARSVGWAGVSYNDARATFSGRLVEPDPQSSGPFYRYNAVEKQIYFSAFHLRPDTAPAYVAALQRHRPVWLTGYAVSYYLLAQFILEQNLEVPPIQAVITTSEKLTPEMRRTMEQAYKCRIWEEYSTVENALFASECEQGRLHVSPDVATVEILHPDGTPCQPGEAGEVVTTVLMHPSQPLIRYRLGDMAAWSPEACPCGRAMPVLQEVLGRVEDVLYAADGRQMVRFHGIWVDQPHVREGQIVQEEIDLIRAKVVPLPGFCLADEQEITRRIQQRMGETMRVHVDKVDHIPRNKSGKFRAVVNLMREKPENKKV